MDLSVVILAGGFATRMETLCYTTPKAMLSFVGYPFLLFLVDYYLRQGVRLVIICAGHLNEVIIDYFANFPDEHLKILAPETEGGTGGDLLRALAFVPTKHLLVVMGDVVIELDLKDAWKFHQHHKAAGTLVITRREDAQNRNAFHIDSNQKILYSAEAKPQRPYPNLQSVKWYGSSTGTIFFQRDVLQQYPQHNIPLSLERQLLPDLIEQYSIRAYDNGHKFFKDFGTYDRYIAMQQQAHLIPEFYGIPTKL